MQKYTKDHLCLSPKHSYATEPGLIVIFARALFLACSSLLLPPSLSLLGSAQNLISTAAQMAQAMAKLSGKVALITGKNGEEGPWGEMGHAKQISVGTSIRRGTVLICFVDSQ